MALDPFKVAPRTMFESEVVKAEKKYRYWLKIVMNKLKTAILGVRDYNELYQVISKFTATKAFNNLCREAARQVVTMLAVGQHKTWRQAAAASSKGRRIFLALQKELTKTPTGGIVDSIIEQNAQLIKTVPQNIAQQFSKMAGEAQFAGLRPDELLAEFKKRAPHLTDVELRRIARTETGKAATALMQARATQLGLPLYVWSTVKDGERVRASHRLMEGVICAWDDPPNPELLAGEKRTFGNYHPRGIFNCRCDPMPITDVNQVVFPARVHYHGSIVTVKNANELRQIFGGIAVA